jgi:hypothetical protein
VAEHPQVFKLSRAFHKPDLDAIGSDAATASTNWLPKGMSNSALFDFLCEKRKHAVSASGGPATSTEAGLALLHKLSAGVLSGHKPRGLVESASVADSLNLQSSVGSALAAISQPGCSRLLLLHVCCGLCVSCGRCVCMYVCMMHVCMYVFMYVWMHARMYVCMYVCVDSTPQKP